MLRNLLTNKWIFLFLVVPLLVGSGEYGYKEPKRIWVCSQVVKEKETGKPILYLSQPWEDTFKNHYEMREKDFAEYVRKITQDQTKPLFSPSCRDYFYPEKAIKHRDSEKENAKKLKLTVVELNWRWSNDKRKERESK